MADLIAAGAFNGITLPVAVAGCRLSGLPALRLAVATAPAARAIRVAAGQWLMEGAAASDGAVDVSDAFAGLMLEGPGAAAVLARLVPLDLDPTVFPPGLSARSLLRHVPLVLTAREDGFALLVPRSYARSAAEDIVAAMRAVAARRSG